MNEFHFKNRKLFTENVAVQALAARYGTPLYVYSRSHLKRQYQSLASAMKDLNPLICYSVKANSNIAVVRTLLNEGAGLDIVSGGELFRALRVGAAPSSIVFAGVGKTSEEINYALRSDILFFTVESESEARRISMCARRLRKTAKIVFRVNPDTKAGAHKYVTTASRENKFGLDIGSIMRACHTAARLPNVELAGLHMHIGSQILSPKPFGTALRKIIPLCSELKRNFPSFQYLDVGGGIGISYSPDQKALDPEDVAAEIIPLLRRLDLSIVMEPGRFLVGNSGILVCTVQYIKDSGRKKFIIADAAMNDLIRPSLYESHHEVLPVAFTGKTVLADLVGPVCESGDFIAQNRPLPAIKEGDLLAIMSAGAYGFTMASNYNSRRRPAEVMVEGNKHQLVRERETWRRLVDGERLFR